MDTLFDPQRERRTVTPGAVHLPDWLDLAAQRRIAAAFREWADGPVPLRRTALSGGRRMSVQTVCLGWHWSPYRYTRAAVDVNGAAVLPLPPWLADLGRAAVADAYDDPALAAAYRPDTALVNFYDGGASMGMHQDRDETSGAPVVSLSVGDRCVFRFGNTETRTAPYDDVALLSGDAFVFGGPARYAFHGVPRTIAGSADPDCGLSSGRINITLRETGL